MNTKNLTALILSVTLSAASSACATVKSVYTPEHVSPGEIVWKFDGRLKASQNGTDYGLSDLGDAVACVPEAKSKAGAASTDSVMMWSMLGVGIAAVAAGSAVTIWGASDNIDGTKLGAGLGTLGGGLLFTLLSIPFAAKIYPDAIDAVNLYNDMRTEIPSCKALAQAQAP